MEWNNVDLSPYTEEQIKQRNSQLKDWQEKQIKLSGIVHLDRGESLIWDAIATAKSHSHVGFLLWELAGRLINKYYEENKDEISNL